MHFSDWSWTKTNHRSFISSSDQKQITTISSNLFIQPLKSSDTDKERRRSSSSVPHIKRCLYLRQTSLFILREKSSIHRDNA